MITFGQLVLRINKLRSLVASGVLVLVLGLSTTWAADDPEFADDYVPTVFITGANRGLGLGFTQQYLARGWKVIASCRKPDKAEALNELAEQYPSLLTIEQLDVVDFERVDALAAKYSETPVDVLLLNAGISGGNDKQMFTKMEFAVFEDVLRVNTIAPLKMSEAFYNHVKSSREKKIITVSSSEGSIAQANMPRLYFYRSSKAAVNMVMKNLAMQLKRRGISVAMVNPGPTDTDFMAGLPKSMLRPTEDAVSDMIRNIDGLTVETTGSFYQYDGTIIPW
ncbi:MAG: SDR family oxidoreductase [Gammaproteobacteria bacterium]|nr:SDR family oxidoreductase [Gammaproteobacteria bacterium]